MSIDTQKLQQMQIELAIPEHSNSPPSAAQPFGSNGSHLNPETTVLVVSVPADQTPSSESKKTQNGQDSCKAPSDDKSAKPQTSQPQASPAEKKDLESQSEPEEPPVPQKSFLELFKIFLWFGCNAFGGPAVQIAHLKEQLVVKEKWVSLKRFNRVFAVYQALPGPEALELCCYFGLVVKGRLGSFVAGMGFMLPGFLLCMLFAWLYAQFNLFQNEGFLRSFNCVRAVIPALIVRSVHRIGEGAMQNHKTKEADPILMYYGFMGALLTIFNTPFFITIIYTGLTHHINHVLWRTRLGFDNDILAFGLTTLGIVLNIIYISLYGMPSTLTTASGLTTGDLYGTIFVTGLLAGLLTFGGAYTAIPFIRQSVVVSQAWLTDTVFLDGIALVNCLPTPLVMFVCFDGFIVERLWAGKSGVAGAVLMSLGMMLPAFCFPIFGHHYFEKAIQNKSFSMFLDGVTAGVVGLIVQTSWTLIQVGIRVPMDAAVFVVGLMIVYTYKHRLTTTCVIFLAALSGQVLYANLTNEVAFYEQLHNMSSTARGAFNLTKYGFAV